MDARNRARRRPAQRELTARALGTFMPSGADEMIIGWPSERPPAREARPGPSSGAAVSTGRGKSTSGAEPAQRLSISDFSPEDEDEIKGRARTEHLPEFSRWAAEERGHWDMALAEKVFRVYQQAWHAQDEVESIRQGGANPYAASMGERGATWSETTYYLRLAKVPAADIAKLQPVYQQQLEQYQKYVAASKARTPFLDRYLEGLGPGSGTPRNKGKYLLEAVDRVHEVGPTQFAQEYASGSWGLVSELLRAANVTEDGIQRVRPVWNKANRAWEGQYGLLGSQGPIRRFGAGAGHGEAAFGDYSAVPSRESDLAGWLGAQLTGALAGEAIGGAVGVGESLLSGASAKVGRWAEGRAGKSAGRAAEAVVKAIPEAAVSMGQGAVGQLGAEGKVDLGQAGMDALRDAAIAAGLRGVAGVVVKATRGRGARPATTGANPAPVPLPVGKHTRKRKWVPGGRPSVWQKHPHSKRYPCHRGAGRKSAASLE